MGGGAAHRALAILGLANCASPHVPVSASGRWTNEPQEYVVLDAATPSPFTQRGCKVIVEQVDHTALMVGRKTVGKYEGEKAASFAASFDQDLDDASTTFTDSVQKLGADFFEPGVPSNTFVLRPKMKSWEPGFDSSWSRRDAQMKIVVDVVDSTGALVEQVQVEGTMAVSNDMPIAGLRSLVTTEGASHRMHELASRLGTNVSKYLVDRFTCR